MDLILYSALFFVFLILSHEIFRHYQLMIALIVFLLGPVALLPLALEQGATYFVWMKVYSVSLGVCWLIACTQSALGQKMWALWILWGFVAVNILEAVVNGLVAGNMVTFINAIPGILLLITLPTPKEIKVDSTTHDLLWNTPIAWILGYTLWNWVFIYATWPELCVRHSVILLASLLIGCINNKLWVQSRAFILGIYLLIHFSYDAPFKLLDVSSRFYSPELAMGLALFATVWMIGHFIQFMRNRVRRD